MPSSRRRAVHTPERRMVSPWDPGYVPTTTPPNNPPYEKPPASPAIERSLTYNAGESYEQIIYGKVGNVGAAVVFWEGVNSGRLLLRYLVGYGPIQSLYNIRIGNVPIGDRIQFLPQNWVPTNTTHGYQVYLGTPTQPVCSLLEGFRSSWIPSRYPGRAYVTVMFPQIIEGDTPLDFLDFKCDVEGLLVRNPTLDPTLTTRYYSEDPALHIADLLTSKRYGYRLSDSEVNWAKIRDEVSPYVMEDLGGGIIRYPVGIIFQRKSSIKSKIETLCNHAQLWVTTNDGVYNINVDKPRASTGIVIGDDDFEAGTSVVCYSKGDNDIVDILNVNYIDESAGWIDKSTPIEDPSIHNTNYPLVIDDLDVFGCRFLQQARRIGYYRYNRKQLNLQFKAYISQKGEQLAPGDRFTFNCTERNVSNLDSVVVDCQPTETGYIINLEIYDEDIFSNTIETEIGVVKPTNPSPHDIPPAPTSLILTEETSEQESRIRINFTPAPINYIGQFTRVMARRNAGAWFKVEDTTGNVSYILNVNPGDIYDVSLTTFTNAPYFNESATALTGSITAVGVDIGAEGAKLLVVVSDRQTITYDETGAVNPSVQTTTFTAQKQNTTAVVNWSATRTDGVAITPITNLLSAATGDIVTMSASAFNTQRGTTEGVIVTGTLTDGALTIFDKLSVVKVQKGATGSPGETVKMLVVEVSRPVVAYDTDGVVKAGQTITFTAKKMNVEGTVNWRLFRGDGTELDAATYLSATTGDSVTMTEGNFDLARGTTLGINIRATIYTS